jgi:hypothetical protein
MPCSHSGNNDFVAEHSEENYSCRLTQSNQNERTKHGQIFLLNGVQHSFISTVHHICPRMYSTMLLQHLAQAGESFGTFIQRN